MENRQLIQSETQHLSLMNPIETVIELIRRRWLRIELCRILLMWISIILATSMFVIYLAALFPLPDFLRWTMLTLWLISICFGPAGVIYLIISQPDRFELAEIAEKRSNLKHNYLINALQLSHEKIWPNKLIHRLLVESSQAAARVNPQTVIPAKKLKTPATITAAILIACLAVFLIAQKQTRAGLSALFYPKTHKLSQTSATKSGKATNNILIPENLPVYISAHYPKYLHQPDKQLANTATDITIPEGTRLTMQIRKIKNLTSASLQIKSQQTLLFKPEPSGQILQLDYLPANDTKYAILAKFGNKLLRQPTDENQYLPIIKVIKDQPPEIRIADPGEDVSLPPGEKLKIIITAQDDYKLTEIKLLMKIDARQTKIIAELKPEAAKYSATITLSVPADIPIGSTIEYWAQAKDNRNLANKSRQTSTSRHYKINIISSEQYNNRLSIVGTSLINELQKIVKLQIQIRTKTLSLKNPNQSKPIATGQRQIESMLKRLAAKKYPSELIDTAKTLASLANDTAHRATIIAQSLKDDISQSESLADLQYQIILTLQSLIEMLDKLNLTQKNQTTEPANPIDTSQAMEKLAKLLKEFTKAQELAIKSSASLIPKSPEDFSQNDKALLDKLTQLQEQWEKFLQQAVNDMNKVADQDFSATVTRDELIEIQSQVQISADEMKKKSIKMAVSAEQIGLELAEELTHNLERWLAHKPDRTKWELEEPSEPIDVPLAELPEELEDIVGDLIEQEEDLYDEIEDTTSSWADSLDKGAGWDVSEGPISNYSAKGITGNILPNNSEIAGRSGEGRTGRSSGEFVEKTAYGKGGRRTPTRLTKDAFQSGQIEDLSKDSPGGATGGGKLSGAGAEGLTGHTPKTPNPQLGALRHKQAVLLMKAKLASIQAQKHHWGNFQLDKITALLAKNLSDMDRRAYRSVLARKTIILNSLRTSKTLIASKFQLDRPAIKIPKLLNAQIQSTDINEIPPAMRKLIENYYAELSAMEK